MRIVRRVFPKIAVSGASNCTEALARTAYAVGAEIARRGAVLLTGGRGGVMAGASAGARDHGGLVLGILPGADEAESPPNEAVQVALFTGLGQARNQVLVLSADVVVAVGGGWGTLSEIALALKHGKPVVVLEGWRLERPDGAAEPRLLAAASPREAIELAWSALEEISRAGGETEPMKDERTEES